MKTVKLELTFLERVRIDEFLPPRASHVKAIIARDFRVKMEFTQEEIKEHRIDSKVLGSQVSYIWKEESNDIVTNIEITELELKMLQDGFERLNTTEKLPTDNKFLALCDKVTGAKVEG